jgi:hypothetical protein
LLLYSYQKKDKKVGYQSWKNCWSCPLSSIVSLGVESFILLRVRKTFRSKPCERDCRSDEERRCLRVLSLSKLLLLSFYFKIHSLLLFFSCPGFLLLNDITDRNEEVEEDPQTLGIPGDWV